MTTPAWPSLIRGGSIRARDRGGAVDPEGVGGVRGAVDDDGEVVVARDGVVGVRLDGERVTTDGDGVLGGDGLAGVVGARRVLVVVLHPVQVRLGPDLVGAGLVVRVGRVPDGAVGALAGDQHRGGGDRDVDDGVLVAQVVGERVVDVAGGVLDLDRDRRPGPALGVDGVEVGVDPEGQELALGDRLAGDVRVAREGPDADVEGRVLDVDGDGPVAVHVVPGAGTGAGDDIEVRRVGDDQGVVGGRGGDVGPGLEPAEGVARDDAGGRDVEVVLAEEDGGAGGPDDVEGAAGDGRRDGQGRGDGDVGGGAVGQSGGDVRGHVDGRDGRRDRGDAGGRDGRGAGREQGERDERRPDQSYEMSFLGAVMEYSPEVGRPAAGALAGGRGRPGPAYGCPLYAGRDKSFPVSGAVSVVGGREARRRERRMYHPGRRTKNENTDADRDRSVAAAAGTDRRHRPGVTASCRIGLFGSFARGDAGPGSDVDVLVEFADPFVTFDRYMDLKFYLEDLFGRRVDLVIRRTLKPRIRRHRRGGDGLCRGPCSCTVTTSSTRSRRSGSMSGRSISRSSPMTRCGPMPCCTSW